MPVIVSLCNEQRSPEQGLLLFDIDRKAGTWIPVGARESIMGTRGICANGDFLYAAYTVGWHETHVASYKVGESVELVDDVTLPDVSDPHSICIFEDRLLVASTGTDEVVAYALDHGAVSRSAEQFWRATDERRDTHHVNSVCSDGASVVISAFGPREGEFWSSARSGYLYDVTARTYIAEDVYQPHSVRAFQEGLCFAESSRQTLRFVGGKTILVGGYVRGCDRAADGMLLVGTNAARRVSRSRGEVTNAQNIESTEGERVGTCSIVSITGAEVPLRSYIDISSFGAEIYDIVILSGN